MVWDQPKPSLKEGTWNGEPMSKISGLRLQVRSLSHLSSIIRFTYMFDSTTIKNCQYYWYVLSSQ
jgi:hypothetical protein